MRNQMHQIHEEKGMDPDAIEILKQKHRAEANLKFEAFYKDKTRFDAKGLCVDAYELILTNGRVAERDILNKFRDVEY